MLLYPSRNSRPSARLGREVSGALSPSPHPWNNIPAAWTPTPGRGTSRVSTARLSSWATLVQFLLFARGEIRLTDLVPPGVGKTSLLQRYTQNKFDPKNTTSTSGAFFITKKVYVNGLKVRLQLWDTAGQERFRSMVRLTASPPTRHDAHHPSQAPMYCRGRDPSTSPCPD